MPRSGVAFHVSESKISIIRRSGDQLLFIQQLILLPHHLLASRPSNFTSTHIHHTLFSSPTPRSFPSKHTALASLSIKYQGRTKMPCVAHIRKLEKLERTPCIPLLAASFSQPSQAKPKKNTTAQCAWHPQGKEI